MKNNSRFIFIDTGFREIGTCIFIECEKKVILKNIKEDKNKNYNAKCQVTFTQILMRQIGLIKGIFRLYQINHCIIEDMVILTSASVFRKCCMVTGAIIMLARDLGSYVGFINPSTAKQEVIFKGKRSKNTSKNIVSCIMSVNSSFIEVSYHNKISSHCYDSLMLMLKFFNMMSSTNIGEKIIDLKFDLIT